MMRNEFRRNLPYTDSALSACYVAGTGGNRPMTENEAKKDMTAEKAEGTGTRGRKDSRTRQILKRQRRISARRIWCVGLVWLYFIIYYPIGMTVLIARNRSFAMQQKLSAVQLMQDQLRSVSGWIGARQSFAFMHVIIASVIGISGFAYLFDSVKVDFYGSQPVSRRSRFRSLFWNGILIYLIPVVLCTVLSTAIAAGMHAMTGTLLQEILLETLHLVIAFLASYSLAVLADVLCGNLWIAVLLTAFFQLLAPVTVFLYGGIAQVFYRTYAAPYQIRWLLSPLYNTVAAYLNIVANGSGQPGTLNQLRRFTAEYRTGDLVSLVTGVAALVLARHYFLGRHTEDAGKGILHQPLKTFVRVSVSAEAALLAATIVWSVFSLGTGRQAFGAGLFAFSVVVLAAASVILCGIIEAVCDANIRRFFRRPAEMAAAFGLTVLVTVFFRYDLSGYDTRLPDPGLVESASLASWSSSYSYYGQDVDDMSRYDSSSYAKDNMRLTDIAAVERIAEIGMKCKREQNPLPDPVQDGASGWEAQVSFRMKSGRVMTRNIVIPYDIDPALMDAVVGTDEYREGFIPIYGAEDEALREAEQSLTFSYDTDIASRTGSGSLYEKFAEAYRKDLLKYNFTLASTQNPVGTITLQSTDDVYGYGYISQQFPVYKEFTNTIDFLMASNLWVPPAADSIDSISSVNVYVYDDNGREASRTYTDRDQIREIMESVDLGLFSSDAWSIPQREDYIYNVTAEFDPDRYENAGIPSQYVWNFPEGKVPAFVQKDFGNPEQTLTN